MGTKRTKLEKQNTNEKGMVDSENQKYQSLAIDRNVEVTEENRGPIGLEEYIHNRYDMNRIISSNYVGEHFPVHNYLLSKYNYYASKYTLYSLNIKEGNNIINFFKELGFEIIFKKVESYNLNTDIDNDVYYINKDCNAYEIMFSSLVLENEQYQVIIDIYVDDIKNSAKEKMPNNLLDYTNVSYNLEIYYNEKTKISFITDKLKEVFVSEYKPTKKEKRNFVYMVNPHLRLDRFEINQTKLNETNLNDYYNDDFADVHKFILDKISRKNESGLMFLHGSSGAGKTTYIRYLITKHKYKSIYVPPDNLNLLASSSFLSLLQENENSILILEDCGDIIKKNNHSPVIPNLLNMADGMFGDIVNSKIIITFNEDIKDIDEKFLRNGRCFVKYEFKELAKEKVNKLNSKYDKPMILADIFKDDKTFINKEDKQKIGF